MKQFFNFQTGPAKSLQEKSPPFLSVSEHFPDQVMDYLGSRQFDEKTIEEFALKLLNDLQLGLVIFSLFIIILVCSTRIPFFWKFFSGLILTSLIINAFICGMIYVAPRYQSRVAWLLTLPVFLILIKKENWSELKKLWYKGI